MNPQRYPLLLYKNILRLHYGLPKPARLMGDTYVRDEFRRHKNASEAHVKTFIDEWTTYCVTLSKQLSAAGIVRGGGVGKPLDAQRLDAFADEQIRQLLELRLEAERHAGGDSVQSALDAIESKLRESK